MALGTDADGGWVLAGRLCPECNRLIIHLENGEFVNNLGFGSNLQARMPIFEDSPDEFLVRSKTGFRPPCPPEVPPELTEDYNEACLVIEDSPKASAALSRRALQKLLRDVENVEPGNLATEIQQVLDRGSLPSHISQAIDAIRNIGNFAAHPIKSEKSGEVIPVEPGEAEWNLDVLEALFDFYFVQPERLERKREALNRKLGEAGKPQLKR